MKILWISHLIPYPPKGGVLQRSYHLVRELAKYHDLYLIAFVQRDLLKPIFSDCDTAIEQATRHLNGYCKEVKLYEIPCDQSRYGKHLLALKSLFSTQGYTLNWLKHPTLAQEIKDLDNAHNFDAIHADTISLAPYALPFKNKITTLDHHNIESHMMLRRAQLEKNYLKKIYFYQEGIKLRFYEKKVCPLFDQNITCSNLDSERLLTFSPSSKTHAIPNGVDIDYFSAKSKQPPTKYRLLFAGRLNAYSNTKAALFIAEQLWPALKRKIPQVSIDIVGAHPPAKLKLLASSDNSFRVHGFVDEIRPFFEEAEVYICPITDGGGTKLKILDALSMGKAIVADPIAAEGIEVTDGKDIIFAENIEDYVDQIWRLCQTQELRETLEKNARLLVESHYSYSKIGKQLAELFQELDKKN